MTQLLQAQAFTHGYDIYFNRGKFQPYIDEGKHLLSHELAHELLRQRQYKRFVPDVHDVWTKHFHANLDFEQYGVDFQKTDDKPMFLTLDMSTLKI